MSDGKKYQVLGLKSIWMTSKIRVLKSQGEKNSSWEQTQELIIL